MRKENRIKFMAAVAVLLMAALSFAPFADNDEKNALDAAVGDGESYEYRIVYNASVMSSSSAAISVADMTPISHASTSRLESLNAGSWTWDTTTGFGPFNSFYAAFDLSDGNKFYAVLDPGNLTRTISGTTLSPLANYNIMWVIPTVYWATDTTSVSNDTLVLSNDSTKGTAYAHTINGHVYNYLALAVYEGSTTTVDDSIVLTSQSGVDPTAARSRAVYRTYAHNYTMDPSLATDPDYPAYSMLWNFNQWDLYKYCCYALIENFNSQYYVGGGHTFGSTYVWQTGSLDTYGPYAGYAMRTTADSNNGGNSVKLFIENAWGALSEYIDGIVFHYNSAGNVTMYIDTSATPTDATTTGAYVVSKTITTLSSGGYPGAISTDADIWGWGTATGGSESKGLTDYYFVSSSGNKIASVGGHSSTNSSTSQRYGLSYADPEHSLGDALGNFGSRLAFVFDADVATPVNVTISVNDSSYGSLSDSASSSQSSIVVPSISPGTTASVTTNTITIGSTMITATPATSDDHWTYTFDGFYDGQTKITSSITLDSDITITAKFNRTLTTHDATIESNNTAYGTVSTGSLTGIPYGEAFTVNGNSFTIYNHTVTANVNPSTVEYIYSFDEFQTEGVTLTTGTTMTSDMTIRAIFYSTQITHTVTIQSNDDDYGTVSDTTLTAVPGGSYFTISGNNLTIDGQTFTPQVNNPDAQYTYAFVGWYDALTGGNAITNSTRVLDDMDVYARFSATLNTYTVTIQDDSSGYGSVAPTTVNNVPYGTVITASDLTLDVNGTPVTATPLTDTDEYDYSFEGWTVGATEIATSYTVVGATTITANFDRNIQKYTVYFTSLNPEYGSVIPGSILNVEYGTAVSSSGATVTVGSNTATATPSTQTEQYTYAFSAWSGIPAGGTITGDVTISASFTQTVRSYTITWSISGVTTTETYQYGETPEHADPAPPSDDYYFDGWNPEISIVTGDQTYTAVFQQYVHITVYFDATTNGGTLVGSSSKSVSVGFPYGELPTATKSGQVFSGWFTAAEGGTRITETTVVTTESDQTLYAQFDVTGWAKVIKTVTNLFPILLLALLILGYVAIFKGRN